ncbi:hypothetical protein [Desulfovibrio sp. TomC]|uniref:hypothetical protein n=1 Tax=Desulfovibrio sp. TomC TaxID=1562888 RepID=UPI0005754E9D|nr:hypothetical protein [Desulfovibrio sp. TomC]KHK02934.1 hypothetical protein NY78_1463 [Desulfovibrio sp. TomC]
MRFAVIRLFVLLLLLSAWPAAAGQSVGLGQYKALRNDFVKVTDIKERERFEERYQEIGGKVTLQKVPYKEVMLTAELIQKPPSSMDTMFVADAAQPDLKICMVPFDATGKALDESCEAFKFQSFVRGNIGTASFRLDGNTARYEFHMIQRQGEKGSAIKLWVPTN